MCRSRRSSRRSSRACFWRWETKQRRRIRNCCRHGKWERRVRRSGKRNLSCRKTRRGGGGGAGRALSASCRATLAIKQLLNQFPLAGAALESKGRLASATLLLQHLGHQRKELQHAVGPTIAVVESHTFNEFALATGLLEMPLETQSLQGGGGKSDEITCCVRLKIRRTESTLGGCSTVARCGALSLESTIARVLSIERTLLGLRNTTRTEWAFCADALRPCCCLLRSWQSGVRVCTSLALLSCCRGSPH